jgi:hypothetical protein
MEMETGRQQSNLTPLGAILSHAMGQDNDSQPTYRIASTMKSEKQSKQGQKLKPLIQARRSWREIVGDDYEIIKTAIRGYQAVKDKAGWGEYAAKLGYETRGMLSSVMRELNRNGFVNIRVREDELICDYIAISESSKAPMPDRCCCCPESGENCNGRTDYTDDRNKFVPCWLYQGVTK